MVKLWWFPHLHIGDSLICVSFDVCVYIWLMPLSQTWQFEEVRDRLDSVPAQWNHSGCLHWSFIFPVTGYPTCDQLTCANGACYNTSQRCDQKVDCRDSSDEANCSMSCALAVWWCGKLKPAYTDWRDRHTPFFPSLGPLDPYHPPVGVFTQLILVEATNWAHSFPQGPVVSVPTT